MATLQALARQVGRRGDGPSSSEKGIIKDSLVKDEYLPPRARFVDAHEDYEDEEDKWWSRFHQLLQKWLLSTQAVLPGFGFRESIAFQLRRGERFERGRETAWKMIIIELSAMHEFAALKAQLVDRLERWNLDIDGHDMGLDKSHRASLFTIATALSQFTAGFHKSNSIDKKPQPNVPPMVKKAGERFMQGLARRRSSFSLRGSMGLPGLNVVMPTASTTNEAGPNRDLGGGKKGDDLRGPSSDDDDSESEDEFTSALRKARSSMEPTEAPAPEGEPRNPNRRASKKRRTAAKKRVSVFKGKKKAKGKRKSKVSAKPEDQAARAAAEAAADAVEAKEEEEVDDAVEEAVEEEPPKEKEGEEVDCTVQVADATDAAKAGAQDDVDFFTRKEAMRGVYQVDDADKFDTMSAFRMRDPGDP